ncbi:MotA/TolQ/ExbB proton channel family-domain-containing protein [Russula earlei]|uniref:MotA/TolQ/ExbB proton channel family-domain-containing protein n=1 Tax=Russula earlei TaxID=71964 RepID=A0ACC0TRY6_9AGAM|nr:MotA/TolQ/ExbB proton channel family-domain-containing protein [Russula earlei]
MPNRHNFIHSQAVLLIKKVSTTVVADTLHKAAAAIPAPPEKISMWDLLQKGGFIMYPLYFLLAAAIFVFFERLMAIKKASKIEDNFMSIIRDNIMSGNISAARNMAKNTNNPVARMIDKGLQRIGKPYEIIEKSMDNVINLELYKMERNLSILSLIAGVAPLFGFLGTIVGMVQLFYGIASTGEYTLNTIAGGIYTKMITSGSGLIIGLIAYTSLIFYTNQRGPLNDILFILLLFFLIVSTLANPNVIKVSNPKAKSDTKAKQTVVITVDKDQHVYMGQKLVPMDQLEFELKAFLAKETEKPSVVINGDSTSHLGTTIQVMQVIKKLGATPVLAVDNNGVK